MSSVLESTDLDRSGTTARTQVGSGSLYLVLAGLFLSGVAAIINQTVWQRALKVYLAGSEAISSMIVVLVFMLGLGLGAAWMGRNAPRILHPLKTLCAVEVALCVTNLLIAWLLTRNLSESAYALQKAAVAIGIPLRALYALISAGVLLIPCFLMGVTMPLVSEASQQQLKVHENRFLTVLFFLNTLGAVAGGLMSGYLLMPLYGQKFSLILAAALNLGAGALLLLPRVGRRKDFPAAQSSGPGPGLPHSRGLRRVEVLGFLIGFLALTYEMYLFRAASLACQPLPYTFSAVLCFYLFFWSIGVWAARWVKSGPGPWMLGTGLVLLFIPQLQNYYRWGPTSLTTFAALTTLPCIGFGVMFGRLVSSAARNWGTDVGRFYSMNTLGSCLGIVTATMVGYSIHPMLLGWSIAVGYIVLGTVEMRRERPAGFLPPRLLLYGGAALTVIWSVPASDMFRVWWRQIQPGSPNRIYLGPDGVVQVLEGKAMNWDGLWHSNLSGGTDHIGTNNWLLAAVPYFCHNSVSTDEAGSTASVLKGLVIGLGTGITVGTLAGMPDVGQVLSYELNPKLRDLLSDFPEGTLQVGRNPKVKIEWRDGRTALALSSEKYDIITQQPTYLKQAGSSLLLSKEYMTLIRDHLAPGGVYCIYCNAFGRDEHAVVVRRTAAEVFNYCQSFGDGYMLVVSQSPFDFARDKIEAKIAAVPENTTAGKELRAYGADALLQYLDDPKLDWASSPVVVTDNHPIAEYPEACIKLVQDYRKGKKSGAPTVK